MVPGKPPDRTSFYGSFFIALRKTATLSISLQFIFSAVRTLSLFEIMHFDLFTLSWGFLFSVSCLRFISKIVSGEKSVPKNIFTFCSLESSMLRVYYVCFSIFSKTILEVNQYSLIRI